MSPDQAKVIPCRAEIVEGIAAVRGARRGRGWIAGLSAVQLSPP